ncbi:MAG: hypothetical protein H8E44_33815 [Planctomycetes bacterium]|nr:hypothetical protein [Planctomycetota bacterium]MBL7037112.1 hypothetical protein [Pirellulaceae bacterium]
MSKCISPLRPVTCRCVLIATVVILGTFAAHSHAAEPTAEIAPVEGWSTFFGGDQVKLHYRLQTPDTMKGRLAWSHSAQRRPIARGERAVTVDETKPTEVEIPLQLPEVRDGVVFDTDLTVQLLDSRGEVVAEHQRVVRLFPRDPFSDRHEWLEELKIVLYDPPGQTADVFDDAEVPYKTARSLSNLEETSEGIVVIGEGVSLADHANLPEVMTKVAASGVPVFCLAPADGRLAFPGSEAEQPTAASVSLRRGDVITELDKRLDAEAWPPDGELTVTGLEMTSFRGRVLLSVAESPQLWPWFEVTYPDGGRMIVCGFGIIRCWQAGPTPRYLLASVLEQLSESRSRLPDGTLEQ